jgi:hypothetical protein
MLLCCLMQSFQSFDELEDGTEYSVISQLDVAGKCLGATYLKKNSFRDWASVRYPKMVNFIFQPHSMKATTEQRTIDVLFATQAGFVCALHADAVLASVLQAAAVASISATDHIVSLSELHGCSAGISSSTTVPEPRILMSDIVQRLLSAANPASGTNSLHSIVSTRTSMSLAVGLTMRRAVYAIDDGSEMKVTVPVHLLFKSQYRITLMF